jgi:rubrerythrin
MQSTHVKTASDLMSIALQAEREAIRRYAVLTEHMQKANNTSAAALFKRMINEEKKHEQLLLKWMAQEGIKENPEIKTAKWVDPKISTTYDDDACDPNYSTPYRALAFAVHNEEIAFRFYTHIAANSEDKSVIQYAETLAREELGHATLLRAERRKAYREECLSHTHEPELNPGAVYNESDLLAAAIHIDSYLVEQMDVICKMNPQLHSLALDTKKLINKNKAELFDKTLPGVEIITNLGQLKLHNSYMMQKFDQPNQELQRLSACCDRSFVFYDTIVETAVDEKVMLGAQALTSLALDRIGILNTVLGNSVITEIQ